MKYLMHQYWDKLRLQILWFFSMLDEKTKKNADKSVLQQ